jgi:hypothetical protein
MMAKMNSRWRKGAQRYDGKRTVERAHWVKDSVSGARRLVRKAVTEILFVAQAHEACGWRNGARIRKI